MKLRYHIPAGFTYSPDFLELIEGNHVLIAGTVGAGKSVFENGIINAILCTKDPGQTANGNGARLVLIDPKHCELYMYRDLPHTIGYADNIPDIVSLLYQVRGIVESRLLKMQKERRKTSAECPIYVFIDELVDLVTSPQGKEIKRLLSDIASISRAAGVFFVTLTQSPARAIIPAAFKLLFNCRVALRCNNSIESRQIIDDDSAVKLPRHGLAVVQQNLDRYYLRIPFYDDSQLEALAANWSRQNRIKRKLFHL